jgi:hypothetical protein
MLKWMQCKLEDGPLDKIQSATKKEWTTIVVPADDFDFVGDKNELYGPLQTEGVTFSNGRKGIFAFALGCRVTRPFKTRSSVPI